MPINFPDTPTLNQSFTAGNRTWKWDGSTWQAVGIGLTATSPVVLTGADISFDSTAIQANADAIATSVTDIGTNSTNIAANAAAIQSSASNFTNTFMMMGS
jgi:hypothetical protein